MSCENTVQAVSDMLGGLPIDGYYALAMDDITKINSFVDGVTITFEDDLTEINSKFQKGATVTLTDEEAYDFVRARMGVGKGDNLSRMSRQKQYLKAFMDKAGQKLSADAGIGLEMYDELAEYATTDITAKVVSKLASDGYQYNNAGIYEFEGTSEIGQALKDGEDHAEFYLDETSVRNIMTELYTLK